MKGEVKDNLLSEGDQKQTMVLQDLSEDGATEADQKGEDQEEDEEEGESCYLNCDVTVMVFSCSMIFYWLYSLCNI